MELTVLLTREGGVNGAISTVLGKRVHVDKRTSGAPYIKGDNHYLSLSHKDGYMVVALSDRPVGVDIERVVAKDAYFRIADNYFAEKIAAGDADAFFRGWTRRESFGKMLGEGLSPEVMNLNMSLTSLSFRDQTVYFVEKRIDDYMITVAGAYPDAQMLNMGEKEDEE